MLEMSEGSKRERLKEIIAENEAIANTPDLSWGNQISASFGRGAATALDAHEEELYSSAKDQLSRLKELAGIAPERDIATGFGGLGRKKEVEDLEKFYQDNAQVIEALKAQGHDVKNYEELSEGVFNQRKEAVEEGMEVSEAAYRDNWWKALAADIIGGTAGRATTETGMALTITQLVGGEAAFAAKSALRAMGSIAAIEGPINFAFGRERFKDENKLLGIEVTEREINLAGLQEGAVSAVFGVGVVGAGRVATSGFTKVNGYLRDRDVAKKMKALQDRVDTLKSEKGAVTPEVEAANQTAADIQTVYENKPADMTAEQYTQEMSERIDELQRTPVEEPKINETLEKVYETNYEKYTPVEAQTIEDAKAFVEEFKKQPKDMDALEKVDIMEMDVAEEFLETSAHKTQMDELMTCMTGGAK